MRAKDGLTEANGHVVSLASPELDETIRQCHRKCSPHREVTPRARHGVNDWYVGAILYELRSI